MEIGTVKVQTELSEVTRPVPNQEDGTNSNFPITNTHTVIDYKKKLDGIEVDQFTTKMTIESENTGSSESGLINVEENMKYEPLHESEESKGVKVMRDVKDAPLTLVDEDDGLMKFLGKACGVGKERLIDEDFEPYTKLANSGKQKNEGRQKASDAGFSEKKLKNMNMNYDARVGERLAHQGNDTVVISSAKQTDKSSTEDEVASKDIKRVHNDSQSEHIHKSSEQETQDEKQRMYIKRSETRTPGARKGSYPNQTNVQVFPPSGQNNPRTTNAISSDTYNFNHFQRGYMFTIVNDQFARQSPRDGAHWDLLKMREIARKFGFLSLNYNQERNLTKSETMHLLSRARNTDHSDCDCFMFMISTHGLEQRNSLKGGKVDHALVCADDQLIFTSTIMDMFNDTNCPTLKGKPKIFYIQACRGEKLDHGGDVFVAYPRSEDKTCSASNDETTRRMRESFDVSDTNWGQDSWASDQTAAGQTTFTSSFQIPAAGQHHATGQTASARSYHAQPSSSHTPSFMVPKVPREQHRSPQYRHQTLHAPSRLVNKIYAPTPYAIVETPSLKCDNDMLVMFAIPPGMFAWRNTSEGSWMIDYLHQVLMAYDMRRPKNFLNLMTKVSSLMSRRTTNTPSAPSMHAKKAVSVIEHKLDKDIFFQQKVPVSEWVKKSKTFAL
ncbi:uncharacterized protein LOC123563303 [Mercenaria mercenaria]|uniref:uncharacterized protein LOC123563303 n=1 Tax=Mercenaria mercenaria TaxID=6596 RepID=UPI00234F3315|nr:uncharacterized protein LOC123563303 [Mercenaria mercenaria]